MPLAAGAHLAVSPLMASSLEGTGTSHVAVRASFGQQSVAAMACTQRHTEVEQGQVQGDGANACLALGWDWNRGDSFGLSVRTHVLDSRGGLYRYGTRCFGGSCGGGGAGATELGLGGFAKLSGGLRLGWNWWHGWADDLDGGSDVVRYSGLGHSAGSLALESADGTWSLYLQQPLRAEGNVCSWCFPPAGTPPAMSISPATTCALTAPSRPVRLGLSSRLDLTRRGGFMALDLGAEQGVDGPCRDPSLPGPGNLHSLVVSCQAASGCGSASSRGGGPRPTSSLLSSLRSGRDGRRQVWAKPPRPSSFQACGVGEGELFAENSRLGSKSLARRWRA